MPKIVAQLGSPLTINLSRKNKGLDYNLQYKLRYYKIIKICAFIKSQINMHLKKTHTPTCQAEKGYFSHSLQAQSNGIYVP